MNQQPAQLCLKPGVTLAERDGQIGLAQNGRTRLARDALKAESRRALERVPRRLCTLQRHRAATWEKI